jgi:hypothetical protein
MRESRCMSLLLGPLSTVIANTRICSMDRKGEKVQNVKDERKCEGVKDTIKKGTLSTKEENNVI